MAAPSHLLNPKDSWSADFNAGSAQVAFKRNWVIGVGEDYLLRAFFHASHAGYALIGVNVVGTFFVYFHCIYRADLGASSAVGAGFDLKDSRGRELGYYGQSGFLGIVHPEFGQAAGY